MRKNLKDYIKNDHNFDKTTMIGIFCMLIIIAGVIGFCFEFVFYYFNSGMKNFYWRGGNFLPWINIYAIGALMMYFIAYRLRKNPLKVFLVCATSAGILEYFSGLAMYIIGDGFRCWDYNQEILTFGSIHGFTCGRSIILFGLAGLILIYFLIPLLFKIANNVDKKVLLKVSVFICSIILLDEFYNLAIARIFGLPRASDVYRTIGFKYMRF